MADDHRIGEAGKKRWEKPTVEVLSVADTAYCEFVFNPETGFYQEICHWS